MSAAREIEERAARWVLRREEPDWSAADQAALESWLDESMAHKAAFWRLDHGWREADRIAALGEASNPVPGPQGRSWIAAAGWRPMAVAASLLIAIGVAFTLAMSGAFLRGEGTQLDQASFATPVGGRRSVALPDGSKMELNTATAVRAEMTEESRRVWLEQGEAYFEVTHLEGRPFVVHAGPRTITVLGTKFSVRRDGTKVTVAVVEGRVRVDPADQAQPEPSATIAGGDIAIALGPSTLVSANSPRRVESGLSWREGMLVFDQMTLAEAAAEFNRYNRRQIVVSDPEAAGIRIGGTFQASNMEAFVRLLRDAYGLRVEARGERVTISS